METAGRMLGSDNSRGYCLEMICADFLAGVNLEGGDSEILLNGLYRCFSLHKLAQRRNHVHSRAPRRREIASSAFCMVTINLESNQERDAVAGNSSALDNPNLH
jgi:hypothetical protein